MERLFYFKVPRAHYKADAFILWCFDERFDSFEDRNPFVRLVFWLLNLVGFKQFNPEPSLLRAYVKSVGLKHPDVVKWGGGGKALGTLSDQEIAEALFGQMELSERLHGAKEFHIAVAHSNCGGLPGFENDPDGEDRHHRDLVAKVVRIVGERFPEKKIVGIFPRFDGVYRVAERVRLR